MVPSSKTYKVMPRRARKPRDLSFIRNWEATGLVADNETHDTGTCARCIVSTKHEQKTYHFTPSTSNVLSAYGVDLVVSLNMVEDGPDRHDICVFAHSNITEVSGDDALGVIVEDLLQSECGYHTIRHPIAPWLPCQSGDTLWNLPLP
jgi:hypothetical protein